MANIFDYMDWRDISIKKVEFNEVDNLILARLAYFPFDGIVDNSEISLEDAYKKYLSQGTVGRILQKEDIDFFPKIAKSKRFGKIKLSNYINNLDLLQEKQFSAITLILPDNTIYISYRGTDDTIVGWKEDFNMSFNPVVPAQIEAKNYLEKIANKYNNPIRIGGHSKGGNLAVYSAAFCSSNIQDRIINIYNNDGPGFHDSIINSPGYKNILNKITTYMPQTSIIGRFLDHQENMVILKSTQTGIMQHDLYSWQLVGKKFTRDELTNSSEFIDQTITNWLKEVKPEQREKFVDIFFEILNTTEVKTLSEFSNKKFTNAITMLKTYKNIDEESKEIMMKTLNEFLKIAKNNIKIGNIFKNSQED